MNKQFTGGVQPSFHIIQDAQSQIREAVEGALSGTILSLAQGFFSDEVLRLCGPLFSRKSENLHHRGGSDPGSIILRGQRVNVKKPRVRKNGKDVELETYNALQGYDMLSDKVLKHMLAGVSTRRYEGLLDEISNGTGLPKSTVSKAFKHGSRKQLEELNSRDLSKYEWTAVMIDGIHFADSCVVVALGITILGKKVILGLKRGSTENAELCKDLLHDILERGFRKDMPFLFVLDGSKPLRKAVNNIFGENFPVQRCMLHKARNIEKYLPEEYHSEFRRRWKLIHTMNKYFDSKAEYGKLMFWLSEKNHEATKSLEESEEETLTVIQLNAPQVLRKSLLTTNPIESSFSNVRADTRRVKHWLKKGDQIERWAAASLLEAEKKFRAIRGMKFIPELMIEIRRKYLPTDVQAA